MYTNPHISFNHSEPCRQECAFPLSSLEVRIDSRVAAQTYRPTPYMHSSARKGSSTVAKCLSIASRMQVKFPAEFVSSERDTVCLSTS